MAAASPAGKLTLLLGGARSGKSAFALALARAAHPHVAYLVTAEPLDGEMAERIARHRVQRPPEWQTIEAPRQAAAALAGVRSEVQLVVLDCLTLLVANTMGDDGAGALAEVDSLLKHAAQRPYRLVVISNEVGMGLVPPYPSGRVFRDTLGAANQRVAAAAERVILLVAGLPWVLKSGNQEIVP